jgi:glutathione S-transferase
LYGDWFQPETRTLMNLIDIHKEAGNEADNENFEFVYVDRFSEQKNEDLNKANPLYTIPTIVDSSNNLVLGES